MKRELEFSKMEGTGNDFVVIDKRKSSGYPSYVGTEEFRQTIADWMKKRFNVSLDYEKEIIATIGAKEAVFNFHEGFVNPGDRYVRFALVPSLEECKEAARRIKDGK